jgi:hypothetical protein
LKNNKRCQAKDRVNSLLCFEKCSGGAIKLKVDLSTN